MGMSGHILLIWVWGYMDLQGPAGVMLQGPWRCTKVFKRMLVG